MKKILLLFLLAIILSNGNIIFSQISWYAYNTGASGKINSLHFVNTTTGYCCSEDGKILRTTNAGVNWSTQYSSSNYKFRSVTFVNASTGFAGAEWYSIWNYYLFKTTNSGLNWSMVYVDSNCGPYCAGFEKLVFITDQVGYSTGGYSIASVSKTTNGGFNWTNLIPAVLWIHIKDMNFLNQNTGWFIQKQEDHLPYMVYIRKTTDGGLNWMDMYINGVNTTEFKFQFLNENTGYMVTNESYLRKSTNTGQDWPSIGSIQALNLYKCLFFLNEQTGFIGGIGIIRKTTNSGINWINNLVNGNIYMIKFTDASSGYAASDNGIVYKTTNGGITAIQKTNESIPGKYNLYQNYPNPFNPETDFKFDISKAGNVLLNVFDVNGRKITALVDEYLNPGTYNIRWNAAGLSSGVYFYILKTESFTEMRKALLLK
jgi:photosystem II stability/assembly factor-like uncharacterized protein